MAAIGSSRRLACAGLLLMALSAGCHCDPRKWWFPAEHCADIPHGAIPPPVGTYNCQWQTAQAARAELDDFTIHENEWHLGGQQLGPYGQDHLERIASRLQKEPGPVLIVPHFDTERNAYDGSLNQARRELIVQQLAAHGFEDADQRVVLGPSPAEGLYGEEGARYGAARLQGGRMGGQQGGTGGSSFGGQFGGTGSMGGGIGGGGMGGGFGGGGVY